MQSYCAYNMLIGSQKNSYNMPTLLYHNAITILRCLRRSQEIIAQSYTRLVTQYCCSYNTNYTFCSQENLCSMFTLTNIYDCRLYYNNNVFPSFSKKNLDNNIHPYTYITMHSLNHKNDYQSYYTNNILLRSRKNV